MIIDDKGRLFSKISIVDFFIVVVLVMVIGVAYFRLGARSQTALSDTQQLVRVTFYKEAVENFVCAGVQIGDVVENETNGTKLGTIVDVQTADSISYFPDKSGNDVASPMERYSSISITSEVMGYMSDGVLVINGNRYGSGTQIIIRAGISKIFLTISDVEFIS